MCGINNVYLKAINFKMRLCRQRKFLYKYCNVCTTSILSWTVWVQETLTWVYKNFWLRLTRYSILRAHERDSMVESEFIMKPLDLIERSNNKTLILPMWYSFSYSCKSSVMLHKTDLFIQDYILSLILIQNYLESIK